MSILVTAVSLRYPNHCVCVAGHSEGASFSSKQMEDVFIWGPTATAISCDGLTRGCTCLPLPLKQSVGQTGPSRGNDAYVKRPRHGPGVPQNGRAFDGGAEGPHSHEKTEPPTCSNSDQLALALSL